MSQFLNDNNYQRQTDFNRHKTWLNVARPLLHYHDSNGILYLSIKHQGRMQESRLVNADPITRTAALLVNAKELTRFTLNYLEE